jgi:hypothetical protein
MDRTRDFRGYPNGVRPRGTCALRLELPVFPSIFHFASILGGPPVGDPAYAFAPIC